jgi:hypothetical protein
MNRSCSLQALPDDELLRRLNELLVRSRHVESDLIAHIAEVDARRLYARRASPSMFAYATEVLHLSEHEAYLRITVARASREHPMLLALLSDGRLHLSGIARLVPHLTPENREALLERATHRTKRQIEELVASIAPKPDVSARIRKLPAPRGTVPPSPGVTTGKAPAAALPPAAEQAPSLQLGPARAGRTPGAKPDPPPRLEPLAASRYKVQFTASAALQQKLERLQALTPGADLAQVIEQAVSERLERLEAKRFARVKKARKQIHEAETRPSSRYVPAPIRRAVYERDGGRCTYVDAMGRRCTARNNLEYHHHGRPFGRGGDHSVHNLRLYCRVHNTLLAEQEYGRETMSRFRRSPNRVSESTGAYGLAPAWSGPRVPIAGGIEPTSWRASGRRSPSMPSD